MVILRVMDPLFGHLRCATLAPGQADHPTQTDKTRIQEKTIGSPLPRLLVVFGLFLLLQPCSPVRAMEITGRFAVDAVMMTGQNTNRTTFEEGVSKLRWPINVKAPAVSAGVAVGDLLDMDFGIIAEPWGSSGRPMRDLDYLDESQFPGRTAHDGIDIYSETGLDSKALVMSVACRLFPLRTRYFSAGLTAGYRYEEYDYRGYGTSQTGYGSWQDQSSTISGPSTFYTVEYDIYSVGVALQTHIEDTMVLTFEISSFPLVYGSDEDEHLRRNRVSFTETTGSGYQTSFSGTFHVTQRWTIGSACRYARIATDGDQDQYWYGDDPATPGYDDTGYRLRGIDADLNQENFQLSIGTSCRF